MKRIAVAAALVLLVAVAIPVAARQTARTAVQGWYERPTVTTFTSTPWPHGAGGMAYYDDGTMTIIGNVVERSVWELETDSMTLTRVLNDGCGGGAPPCPKVPLLASFGIAWTGKVAYLLGGAQQGLEGYPTNKIWRYDPLLHSITDTGVTMPVNWIDGVAAWHPETREVFLFAGADHSERYLNTLYVFDPERGTFELRGTLPRSGDNGCAVYWPERKSFIWGGGHSGGKLYSDWFEVQPNGTWRKLGDLPLQLDYPTCMVKDGHLVVAGGDARPLSGEGPTTESDAVFLMDLATGESWQAATLPSPVKAYSWANDEDTMWLVRGRQHVYVVEVD